jgi:hypothetical protein
MVNKMSPRQARAAMTLSGNLMLAPMVVALRLPLMMAEAQKGRGTGPETLRAMTEKGAAFAQGLFAVQLSLLVAGMRFWPEVLIGRTPSLWSGVTERAMQAGFSPSGRAVKANYRRLSRR